MVCLNWETLQTQQQKQKIALANRFLQSHSNKESSNKNRSLITVIVEQKLKKFNNQ